jgi:hypothetical protein
LFASIVCEPLPELRPVYSAQFCDAWGKSMLPLCRRYGWSFDTSLGPWAGVAMLTLAAAIPTGKAVLARRAAAQAKEATPPGKGTVTDGEPSRQAGSTVTDTGAAGQGARSVTDTAGVMV